MLLTPPTVLLTPLTSLSFFVSLPNSRYDSDQIFAQELAPHSPSSASEYATLVRYVAMYGEAMRNSTAQVLNDAPLHKAPGTDGIFHPSCLQHGVEGEVLQGQTHEPIVADWFSGKGKLKQYYRMVERATATGLPSNPGKGCAIPSGPGPSKPTPAPAPGGCAAELKKDGCLDAAAADGPEECGKCAEAHRADMEAAGCTWQEVKKLCGA